MLMETTNVIETKLTLNEDIRKAVSRWLIERVEERKKLDKFFDEVEFIETDCDCFGPCLSHALEAMVDRTWDERDTELTDALLDLLYYLKNDFIKAGQKSLADAYEDFLNCNGGNPNV